MEIIRTNYSAIGPFAEAEAPTAPEYPYTELLDAYRGAFGAAEREKNPDQNQNSSSLDDDNYSKILGGDGTFIHPNQAFQSILKHFFGDYFTVDADEELASDMADRWVSNKYHPTLKNYIEFHHNKTSFCCCYIMHWILIFETNILN